MNLLRVGFYKEMPHGMAGDPSIFENINVKQSKSELEKISSYLYEGVPLIICTGLVEDVINPEKGSAGVPSFLTDGVWVWPGDLAYYVKQYMLKLPESFLSHIKDNNYKVPIVEDELELDNVKIEGCPWFDDNG